MRTGGPFTKSEIVQVVSAAVVAVAPGFGPIGAETHLIGEHAKLDSIGFVTLLVRLEQDLDTAVDLSSSFMDQGDVEESNHPFLTVGSLAEHILRLMAIRA